MAQSNAPEQTPQEGQRGRNCGLKKINTTVQDLKVIHSGKTIRLMFQDEAGFGRINKPKYCWCEKGIRPSVPCHHIREYRYAYGAVEPLTGEGYFLIMPYCNTACMNIFLKQLSEQYPDDVILLCCDSAAWHKSSGLILPNNIVLFHIPPYTPEMNPIEQIWKEIRKRGFHNEVFATLDKVVQRLCDTICSLTNQAISSITGRNWIIKSFN
ncbi:IS630 family transposase [Oscillospiraceae bacterium 50-16]